MKSLKHLSWATVAGLVALFVCLQAATLHAEETAPVMQSVPVWKLTDLNGHEVGSAQLRGKVVVVDFWATWCPPCIGEIPGYIELQKKYADKGLVIVGVSVDQAGPDHVRKFVKAKGMNYTIAMADDTITESFGDFDAIPTTFLINREGRIINRKTGAVPEDQYEKLIQQALR